MVMICPTTAIQRSWISSCMFFSPVAWLTPRTLAAAGGGLPSITGGSVWLDIGAFVVELVRILIGLALPSFLLVTPDIPGRTQNHQGQGKPGDRVHQVVVLEGDHSQPANG